MKILVVCQYFFPEEFKVNELVETLVRRGHDVTVLTGKPTYPKGPYPSGYKFGGVQEEKFKGARVIRLPELTRRNGGFMGILQSMLSFFISSSWYSRKYYIDADAIICFQLSPITMAQAALIYKKKTNAILLHWVQDLWPESVTSTTSIKKGPIIWLIEKYVKRIYRNSDYILIQSQRFRESINKKGPFEKKMIYAPNWADSEFSSSDISVPNDIDMESYKNDFVVMFAGNIGEAQDFGNIIKAAKELKEYPEIKFVIVGDGRFRKEAESLVSEYGLSSSVIFLGKHPVSAMPYFFKSADVMLVTLKDEYIFSLTIPSKTQAYMAAGKPILTMLNGEGSRIVKEANCGLTANASDYKKLAGNILKIFNMNKVERCLLGENAKKYYEDNFRKDIIIDRIEKLVKSAI